MARSKKGNLLGKAAATEIADEIKAEDWSKFPDSNYWAIYAKGAEQAIYKIIEEKDWIKIERILSRFWHSKNTWMTICLKTEHVRDLIRALKQKEKQNG